MGIHDGKGEIAKRKGLIPAENPDFDVPPLHSALLSQINDRVCGAEFIVISNRYRYPRPALALGGVERFVGAVHD